MTGVEKVSDLLSQTAALTDFMAVAEFSDQKLWRILVEENLELDLELDEEQGLLVIHGQIPAPQTMELLPLYKMLLEYGRNWPETGGVHMALESDGTIVACYRVALDGLERVAFATLLRNLANAVSAWRTIIGEYQTRRQSGDRRADIGFLSDGGIRV